MTAIDFSIETLGYEPDAPGNDGDGIAHFDVSGRTADGKRAVRPSNVPSDIRELVRANRMTEPNVLRAAIHSLVLVAAWAALSVIGVIVGSLWAWVPVWVCQAFLLHGAYSAMHDAAHGTLFASRRANRVACFLWAVPLGLNASLWRCWHLEHHRATTTGDDPEPSADLSNVFLYLIAFPVAGLAMFSTFYLYSVLALVSHPPSYANRQSARAAVRRDALWQVLFTAGIVIAGIAATHWLVMLWLIPLAAYWCVVSLIFGLPEHYKTATAGSQIDVTRSVSTNKLLSFVIWNSDLHAAHHLVPTVTYGHLPQLDAALGPRVANRSRPYTRYHGGLLCQLTTRAGRRSLSASSGPKPLGPTISAVTEGH